MTGMQGRTQAGKPVGKNEEYGNIMFVLGTCESAVCVRIEYESNLE